MSRIAVIGAGVGGLACARALQTHDIDVTVFERDSSKLSRWQGGMLDLHVPTGQAALRAAGLFERFQALARPEAQELRILDRRTGELVHHELPADDQGSAPEIDRGQLRELLLNSLRPETVHWGQPIDLVVPTGNGAEVHFGDGRVDQFDLVVGADGAWSRTRAAVSPATPAYQGTTMIETYLDDIDNRHPELAAMIGPGSMGATQGRTMLTAQRNSGGHVRVYAAFDMPRDWYVTAGTDLADADAVCEYLLSRFAGWHEPLLRLIRDRDGEFFNRPLFVLPIGHRWDHVPGVTLLGDAAHLMPPYGIGANLALIDGTDLAGAIAAHADPDDGVRAYEAVLFPRSAAAAQTCADMTESMADDPTPDIDAARKLLNQRMQEAVR
jgi:2-polyprenyl-6-methoxyphenol hydroxylase-like FAD-dependent oxidoreductase